MKEEKLSHINYKSKLPNGWYLITEFVTKDESNKNYDTADENFIKMDELEILHLRLLQYYKDFGVLPNVGESVADENDDNRIVEKCIDLKLKVITLSLIC